jgi:hypothetical protein
MADPSGLLHLLIVAALYGLGMVLIADGVREAPVPEPRPSRRDSAR